MALLIRYFGVLCLHYEKSKLILMSLGFNFPHLVHMFGIILVEPSALVQKKPISVLLKYTIGLAMDAGAVNFCIIIYGVYLGVHLLSFVCW